MKKRICLESMLEDYRTMLERARKAQRAAQQDANDHKGRLVSRYDTFKEEAQYLAAGQGLRCLELENTVALLDRFLRQCPALDQELDTVRPGALVEVAHGCRNRAFYLISPHGGGVCLKTDKGDLWIINSSSPLAQALHGKRAGENTILAASGADPVYILQVH